MNIRVLLGFLRPHRRTLALGLVLGLLTTGTALVTPLVTKWVLDSLSTSSALLTPVLWLLVLVIAGATIGLAQWLLFGRLGERVVREARAHVAERILRARVGEITATPTGEVVTRLTADPALLHGASSGMVGLVNAVIGLVGTLLLMGVLDLPLLAVTMVSVVVVVLLMGALLPRIGRAEKAAQESVARMGAVMEGATRAIRTVKAARAEERLIDQVVGHARTSEGHAVNAARTSAWVWTVSWTGVQLAVIAILGIGAWRVSEGLMSVTTLIAFLLYAFQLMGPITELSQHLTALQSGIAAAARLRELDRFEPESGARPAAQVAAHAVGAPHPASVGTAQVVVRDRPAPDVPVLELRGVCARYAPSGPDVVHALDLVIPRRGHVALVGPSGAGKTTVLSLLLRFLEPVAGEVRLDGRPYAEWSPQQVRSRIGYVEQETPVIPGTIGDNVRFAHPDATEEEVARALAAVRLTEAVDALPEGLDTSLEGDRLSGGQRQRIAVARAILRTPEVLLLDEPTAQVDGITERALQDCIADLSARAAVVTIAHRLSTILDADHIVVMEAGRIRAAGTHTELLATDDLYRELVAALRIREEVVALA